MPEPPTTQPGQPPLDLHLEQSALEAMTIAQVRERYRAVWGEPTRSGNRRFMIKRILWKLQANAEGDLPERARRRALEIARDSDLRTTAPRPAPPTSPDASAIERPITLPKVADLTPGTQLRRVSKGRQIVVTVLEDGFAYEGQRYRSLSAVAKAATGSHVSGNAFFGLPPGTRTTTGTARRRASTSGSPDARTEPAA